LHIISPACSVKEMPGLLFVNVEPINFIYPQKSIVWHIL
jgi:hypothetical protein